MIRFLNSLKAFLLLCLIMLLITTTKGGPPQFCPNTTNSFAPYSTYQTNLFLLLSSLFSNANQSNGFYNTTIIQNSEPAGTNVYGLFLCRGVITGPTCQQCFSTAAEDILANCPYKKKAILWEEKCMLRYSDESFFSTMLVEPMIAIWTSGNVSDLDHSRFMKLLANTASVVAKQAAYGRGGGKKYATKEAKFDDFINLYTLAQCTPDLSGDDCYDCLRQSMEPFPSCCYGKDWGIVLNPSCYIKYSTQPFYHDLPTPPNRAPFSASKGKSKRKIPARTINYIVVPTVIFIFLVLLGYVCLKSGAWKRYPSVPKQTVEISNVESLQFDLDTIKSATNNFSPDNKLGQGGFGEVYKGVLPSGQELAVKRLSCSSTQGIEQFKNEVVTMAKLQHRNLVRLLGFCLDEQEKILIYEFVPNKSLDNFLFEPENRGKLDWSIYYKIIEGIARGIIYLHEDSQLKIIHRDLKASNVLLDGDWNAKISDFGMARIFEVDQYQANTNRVVGTFGYMSPEYVKLGQISVKTDIYSFGVLILDIISGKKNTSFYATSYVDLLNYAWKFWKQGKPLELLDPNLRNSFSRNEVIKCIHISLLCVQENPDLRPTIQSIMVMLNSQSVTLPNPQEPAFCVDHHKTNSNNPAIHIESSSRQSTSKSAHRSVDEDTITDAFPRH